MCIRDRYSSTCCDAIIAASQQVELYDREYDLEPALRYGVHTLPALDLPDDPTAAVAAIRAAVAGAARSGKLVVGLGGEHTISAGVGRGLLDALGECAQGRNPLVVVAHDEEPLPRPAHVCRRGLRRLPFDIRPQLGGRDVAIFIGGANDGGHVELAGLDADIIGLLEMENNPAAAIQDLVAGLNAVAGPAVYSYIDTGVIGTD